MCRDSDLQLEIAAASKATQKFIYKKEMKGWKLWG